MGENKLQDKFLKILTKIFVKFDLLVYFSILAGKYLMNFEVFLPSSKPGSP